MISIVSYIDGCIKMQERKFANISLVKKEKTDSFQECKEENTWIEIKEILKAFLMETFWKLSKDGYFIDMILEENDITNTKNEYCSKSEIQEFLNIIIDTIRQYQRLFEERYLLEFNEGDDSPEKIFEDAITELVFDMLVSIDGGTWISEKYNFYIKKNKKIIYCDEELHDLFYDLYY